MAQNKSDKYISGAILQGGGIPNIKQNTPTQYADRQKQYMAKRTRKFVSERAKYASDFVNAKVQGIDGNDFYRYFNTSVRLSDMHSTPTLTQPTDDTKNILFAEEKIDYFPIGAKVETMGSTWLCVNPSNLSSVNPTAVIRRCNTSYNLYDYYGNIVTEPIILEKVTMLGNNNDSGQSVVLMDGYFNAIAQLNDNTKQLGLNQRIVMGKNAFYITGFNDFWQEFSGNYDSTHILYFTVRIEEPDQTDDIEKHIARGKTYSFGASLVSNGNEFTIGDTFSLSAIFLKNGEQVADTAEHPLTWLYTSNAPDIVEVNALSGECTAKASGTAQITAVLTQNTAITARVDILIADTATTPYVAFNGVIPQSIEQYDTATLTATFYEDGTATDKAIEWSFSGANKRSYATTISGNSVEIYCVTADDEPLIVTATYEGKSVTAQIFLEGY